MASFTTMVAIIAESASQPNSTDSRARIFSTPPLPKETPIPASIMAMTTELMSSARPCPKGCSASAGFSEIFSPMMSTAEERQSESVSQESASTASEPVATPTQSLKAPSSAFPQMATTPSLLAMARLRACRAAKVSAWEFFGMERTFPRRQRRRAGTRKNQLMSPR